MLRLMSPSSSSRLASRLHGGRFQSTGSSFKTSKSSSVLLFPGQGSQFVGMAHDFYKEYDVARETIDVAHDTVEKSSPGLNLKQIMFEGPKNLLQQTQNAQPAILTASIAILRTLEQEFGFDVAKDVSYTLGHSLGEYTALVAAKSLDFLEAVKLVRERGLAMTHALNDMDHPTSMLAMVINYAKDDLLEVSGVDKLYKPEAIQARLKAIEHAMDNQVKKLLNHGDVAEVSNSNSSRQIVLSGTSWGVEMAAQVLMTQGLAHRAVELPVSAPFHCSLLIDARETMKTVLDQTNFKPPVVPIISNVTAQPKTSDFALELAEQITHTVCWYKSMLYLKSQGIDNWICLGPNKVIANLVKKEFPRDKIISIATIKDLPK